MMTSASPKKTSPMKKPASEADIAALSFEQAMHQLEEIVRHLENQDGNLDEAITLYEYGVRLKRHCEGKLQEAQMRIDKVVKKPEGNHGLEPLDVG